MHAHNPAAIVLSIAFSIRKRWLQEGFTSLPLKHIDGHQPLITCIHDMQQLTTIPPPKLSPKTVPPVGKRPNTTASPPGPWFNTGREVLGCHRNPAASTPPPSTHPPGAHHKKSSPNRCPFGPETPKKPRFRVYSSPLSPSHVRAATSDQKNDPPKKRPRRP